MKHLVVALCACWAVALTFAADDQPSGRISSAEVRHAVRSAVASQLAAVQKQDFAAAYSFAARGIRRQFSPASFEAMLRKGYPALLRQVRAEFGLVRDNRDDRATVDVTVYDSADKAVRYRYQLVKEGADWRVEGVVPTRPPRADV